MAEVTELVTKFTFQGSLSPLSEFNEGLGSSISVLAGVTAGLVALSGVVNTFVIQTLAGADSIGHLARTSGVGVETIQELGFAASVSGSSLQAMEGTIDSLSKTIGDAAQKGSEDFARLGISVRKNNGEVKKADEILSEVGKRFRELNLSQQEQLGFASSLGIDASLLQLLNRSSEEMFLLQKRARELGTVTQDQQDQIIDFNDSLTVLKFGLSAVQKEVAIGLSPTIKNMAEGFTDWLVANKDLVTNGLLKVGEGINVLLDALGRLKFVIAGMLVGFIALKIAALGFGTVMGVVFSPVVLITAGIIALLLIIDDLMVAFSGGKSVIRDFFKEFFGIDITPILQNIVAGFKEAFEFITADISALFSFITETFKSIAGSPSIKKFSDNFLKAIKIIGGALKKLFDLFLAPIINGLGKIGGIIGKLFASRQDKSITQGGIDIPQNIPPGTTTTNQATTVDQSVRQENFFDIKGENAQETASAVGDVLDRQLSDADNQLGRGGR